MATIREVATQAGVSLATASRVLGSPSGRFPVKRETGDRVRAAAERLGYRINYHMQAVARGRANATGFCTEVLLDPVMGSGAGNFFFDALRRGVEYTTQEAGGALMSVHPGKGITALQRGINYIRERRLDALVVVGRHAPEVPSEFELDGPLPLVILNPHVPMRRARVVFDTQQSMKLVMDHLLSLGHRHLLWLGPEPSKPVESAREQLLVRSAWEAGVTGEVCRVPVADLGLTTNVDSLIDRIAQHVGERLAGSTRRWTAIAAYSDHYAIGANIAMHSQGLRVPADVSVIGIDNLVASYTVPPLTTIDPCFFEMGQRAGRLAAEMVDADEAGRLEMLDRVETVEPKLIIRQSTGPARQSPA